MQIRIFSISTLSGRAPSGSASYPVAPCSVEHSPFSVTIVRYRNGYCSTDSVRSRAKEAPRRQSISSSHDPPIHRRFLVASGRSPCIRPRRHRSFQSKPHAVTPYLPNPNAILYKR